MKRCHLLTDGRERLYIKLKLLQPEFRREPTAYHRRGFQPPLRNTRHPSSGTDGLTKEGFSP